MLSVNKAAHAGAFAWPGTRSLQPSTLRGLGAYLVAFNTVQRAKELSKVCQFGITYGARRKGSKGKSKKKVHFSCKEA